jgi:hypothetical protein
VSQLLQSVHLRVGDRSAMGEALPVRLRVTDEAGNYYAPLGRLASFDAASSVDAGGNVVIGGETWAYIDGACEILLPPGSLRVRIAKGPEFEEIDTHVKLAAGKLSLRFEMGRRADLAASGWHAGDMAAYDMTPHAALLEGAGEGLAVVNLLVHERPGSLANIVAFSGQKPILEQPGTLVAVNTRNDSPLGRLCLLHCHRAIYPLSFALGGEQVWTLDDWCQQCHRIRQRPGLVVAENFFSGGGAMPGEMTALLVLGHIDVVLYEPGCSLAPWYELLDAGLNVPLAVGSRRCNAAVPLGGWRTYARLPAGLPFTYSGWIEGVRRGATWITCGPLVSLERVDEGTVRAEAIGSGTLTIVANGNRIAQSAHSGVVEAKAPADATWLAAQVWDGDRLLAATSAIHQQNAVQSPRTRTARLRLAERLHAGESWLAETNRVSAKQRGHLLDTIRTAVHRLRSDGL